MMTDSSTAKPDEETAVTTAETEEGKVEGVDANTAASSDADEGAKQPASLLEAVKSALKDSETDAEKKDATEESPDSKAGEKESASTASKAEKAAEEEPPPFHTHPRWKKLVQERDTLKSDFEKLKTESGQQKEVVQRFEGFTSAVKQAGLNADDVNNGFEIMRLMKSDPLKAWEKLQPYVDALSQFAGEKLPADLQKKVDDGVMDVDSAKELARTRSQTHFVSERDKERDQQNSQAASQRRIDSHVNAVSGAITAWENDWKAHDPDYQKKQPLVADKILALMNVEGYPKSMEAATDLAKRAKEAVEKQLGNLMPKKAEVRTVTGGSSAKSVTKQPGSMREAIANAARAAT